jgi:hypothetical protein
MSDPFGFPEPRRVPPGEYSLWEAALALLNRDLAATLPEQGPLQLLALSRDDADDPIHVYVALADGDWHGNPLDQDSADDADRALGAVAEAAQDTVSERLWQAWPVCTEHGLGMHLRDDDGRTSWWCSGVRSRPVTPHIRAAVGALDTTVRPHRPNRKQRKEREEREEKGREAG